MAGVVFELTNASLASDSSKDAPGGALDQVTELQAGTFVTPSSGIALSEPIRVSVRRTVGPVETLFDESKLYKITIEEL